MARTLGLLSLGTGLVPLLPDGLAGGGSTPTIRPLGAGSLAASISGAMPVEPPPPKIQAFEQKLGAKRSEETWKRSPTANGTGASHVKTFHCKLSDDAFAFLDTQVNEWLDAHPNYEVKIVTTSIGEFHGKLGREGHLIMQVWV
jgi:hypothetical protein